MACQAESILEKGTDIFKGAESDKKEERFWFHVTTSLLQSSPRVWDWDSILELPPTTTRVKPPTLAYNIPADTISADRIFVLTARGVFEKQKLELLSKEMLNAIVDKLHGSVTIETPQNGVIKSW